MTERPADPGRWNAALSVGRAALVAAGRAALLSHARQDAIAEWRRRLGGEPGLPEGPLRRVLVLCHGNICRSPFAERLLAERGRALQVTSAGLAAADGDPADPTARRVAESFGISLEEHRSRRVTGDDLEAADLVLVMQGSQAQAVRALSRSARERTRLLGDFLAGRPYGLSDPWGFGEDVFAESFGRISRAVERLGRLLDAASP